MIKKSQSKFWGWKDPRTVMTAPFFLDELNKNDDVYLVCVFRKPKKVAASLKKRSGMDYKKGYDLIARYNKMIIRTIKRFVGLGGQE